jgi:hypothetical protein
MLLPKQVSKKRRSSQRKAGSDYYPFHCREFMKNNWCFYEQLYIAVRNKKL